jgi:phosphoglycerate dehydrogenase-like enzyme
LNSDEVRGFYNFARELHNAYHDREQHRFDHRRYRPIVLEGKTVCVVGAGGIGRDVGHLCASVGMRVIGTRRRATRVHRQQTATQSLSGNSAWMRSVLSNRAKPVPTRTYYAARLGQQ